MGLDFGQGIETEVCKIKWKNNGQKISGTINTYEIMQDKNERPYLKEICNYKMDDISYTEQNGVKFLNKHICLQEMANEHIYIMAIDSRWNIIGVYNTSIGNWKYSNMYKSSVASFLVLTGAKAFAIYHNHPNGLIEASDEDVDTVFNMYSVASLLDIEFVGSFIVGKDEYCKIID